MIMPDRVRAPQLNPQPLMMLNEPASLASASGCVQCTSPSFAGSSYPWPLTCIAGQPCGARHLLSPQTTTVLVTRTVVDRVIIPALLLQAVAKLKQSYTCMLLDVHKYPNGLME